MSGKNIEELTNQDANEIIDRIAFEICQCKDGSLSVQILHPDGPVNEFYGRFLSEWQIAKLGFLLEFHLPHLPELIDEFPRKASGQEAGTYTRPELSQTEIMRRKWDALRPAVAPRIFARDNYRCKQCESPDDLTVDHIIPLSKGGNNDDDNLQTLCKSCNSTKRDKIP